MYTPDQLREIVTELKGLLKSPDLPFGVDLALPQVGGNARKTNHDYTGGKLDELIDITIESGMYRKSRCFHRMTQRKKKKTTRNHS